MMTFQISRDVSAKAARSFDAHVPRMRSADVSPLNCPAAPVVRQKLLLPASFPEKESPDDGDGGADGAAEPRPAAAAARCRRDGHRVSASAAQHGGSAGAERER